MTACAVQLGGQRGRSGDGLRGHTSVNPPSLSPCPSSMALFLAALCSSSSACVWRSGAQDGLHPDGEAHGGGRGGRCVALDAALLPGELCRRLAAGLRRALPEQLPGALPCPRHRSTFLLADMLRLRVRRIWMGTGRGALRQPTMAQALGAAERPGEHSAVRSLTRSPRIAVACMTVRVCGCQVAIELRGS